MTLSTSVGHRHVSVEPAVAVGVFLVLHGVAHFVGLRSNISRISDGKAADLLGGAWRVSNSVGLGLLAAAWAVTGVAVMVCGVLVLRRAPSARTALLGTAAASLVLSILCLWASVVGAVINLALIAAAWVAPRRLGLQEAVRASA